MKGAVDPGVPAGVWALFEDTVDIFKISALVLIHQMAYWPR